MEGAREEVERMLVTYPPLHQENWRQMKGWYQPAVDCASPPAWVTLERIPEEWVDLYCHVSSPGENIPISVEPFPVEDLVTTEDEIVWEVKRMRNHRSGGTAVIRDEHLKGWLAKAQKEEAEASEVAATEGATEVHGGTGGEEMEDRREKTPTNMKNWERMVALVRADFVEGMMLEEAMW